MKNRTPHSLSALALYSAAAVLAAGCSGGSSDSNSDFRVESANVAAANVPQVRISGAYIASLAAEDMTASNGSPSTDLNGDGLPNDSVAHVVNTATGAQFRLGVAARDMAFANNELYIVVDELLDGRDWNGDMVNGDVVLLHWSEADPVLRRVDDLTAAPAAPYVHVVGLDGRIVYASKTTAAGVGGSNLAFVEATAPLVPVPITTTDAVGPLTARLLGEDEGLVFLAFDETTTVPSRSLNSDMDDDDEHVLALLDGTVGTSVARSTARAIDPASPRRAKRIAAGDWHVGFLVDEADEGSASRNSSAVGASFRIPGTEDVDTTDNVLSVLTYSTWNADPVAHPPINHGLPGQQTIAFAGDYVATIVSEVADNANINADANPTDVVVRWALIADDTGDAVVPVNNVTNRIENRALFAAPGGGSGLYELSNRFVVVASEAEGGDIDTNDAVDANLVGWLQPSVSSTTWDFLHGATGTQVVEASWVAARESENRLGIALTERIGGVSLNQSDATGTGDLDTIDSIPTFAFFSSNRLVFPGVLVAVDKDDAGIAIANGWSYYRIAELEDSRDRNLDNDESDSILQRTNLTTGASNGLSVLIGSGIDAVQFARFGTKSCAALIAFEPAQGSSGTDFDLDGDRTDVVVRWFRLQ